MKVEARSHDHVPSDDRKVKTRKQKAEENKTTVGQQSPKKAKNESNASHPNGLSAGDREGEHEQHCRTVMDKLSITQIRDFLAFNGQDSSGSDAIINTKCLDMLLFGTLDKCPVCGNDLEFDGKRYSCQGFYSEWSSCTHKTKSPPRKEDALKIPDSVSSSVPAEWLKKIQDSNRILQQGSSAPDNAFEGMVVSLSGRLSRTHGYWKRTIEKHGGKVSNSVAGVNCLVVSPVERERGGSSKLLEAIEKEIPVVREAWLLDSIYKQEPQPLGAYDVASDLAVEGRGIPLGNQDPSVEALQTVTAELKIYGKRGVYKDTKLQERGGKIFEKDGILYNCAFSICDLGHQLNEYCILQLIDVPESNLHLYYKRGKVGDDPSADERLEEWENAGDAVNEFAQLFEEITGNEFEPWEREKKIEKKRLKFFPIDMDDGVDVRYGGLGLRQLGVAAFHSKLEPKVANFMKVLCGQEIYRYALMEMGLDSPDLPVGMLSTIHLKRCEEMLLHFVELLKSSKKGQKAMFWSDFSQRWFTLLHSSRPYVFRDHNDLADNAAAAFETVRDITAASHLIGNMPSSTLEDPLSDRYMKLGCSISPLDNDADDYKMIVKYLEQTYEPFSIGEIEYGVSVVNIFAIESKACTPMDELKKLPNKVLLWCGSRSSNMLRHLQMGFKKAVCSLPAPGYMFGKAIICSDAAAEASRYGFTAVDRPEGFLVLAVVSLGEEIIELKQMPEDTETLEKRKVGVKGIGRKKTKESEHFVWRDDIKVPCGQLVASDNSDSPLEYNEYAVYDPKQASIRFVVEVKYEELGTVIDTVEPEEAV